MAFRAGVAVLGTAVVAVALVRAGRWWAHGVEAAVVIAMCIAVAVALTPFSDTVTVQLGSIQPPYTTEKSFQCAAPFAHQPEVYGYLSRPICLDGARSRRQLSELVLAAGAAALALGVWGRGLRRESPAVQARGPSVAVKT